MPTLKNLVDEVVNIENELIECRDTLKQILIDKKVEGLENESRMSSLIDKVSEIKTERIVSPGDVVIYSVSKTTALGNSYSLVCNHGVYVAGRVRVSCYLNANVSSDRTYLKAQLLRNGSVIQEKYFTHTTGYSYTQYSWEFDVEFGDTIKYFAYSTSTKSYPGHFKDPAISISV